MTTLSYKSVTYLFWQARRWNLISLKIYLWWQVFRGPLNSVLQTRLRQNYIVPKLLFIQTGSLCWEEFSKTWKEMKNGQLQNQQKMLNPQTRTAGVMNNAWHRLRWLILSGRNRIQALSYNQNKNVAFCPLSMLQCSNRCCLIKLCSTPKTSVEVL